MVLRSRHASILTSSRRLHHCYGCLLILLLVSIDVASTEAEAESLCKRQDWFGSRCHYSCHCAKGGSYCDKVTGECEGGCQAGWFGPACQYRSVPLKNPNTPLPYWLTDHNVSTCSGRTTPIDIHFSPPLPFYWLRYSFKDPDYYDTVDMQLFMTDESGQSESVDCHSLSSAEVNANIQDVYCSPTLLVASMTFTGAGLEYLCSLDISGGRNVALKQRAEQTSTIGKWWAPQAVDGRLGARSPVTQCSATTANDALGIWRLTLLRPVNIMQVVVYTNGDEEGFTVTLHAGETLIQLDRLSMAQNPIVYQTYEALDKLVGIIEIKKDDGEPSLTLCEVQVFGDHKCEGGRFGLDCEKSCKCAEDEACEVSTGECPSGCEPEFSGEGCQYQYKLDQCDLSGGFGPSYGPLCELPCNCQNKTEICHMTSGWCQSGCATNFYGIDCQIDNKGPKCSPYTFGRHCSLNCNCQDKKEACLEDGGCPRSGCLTGYVGRSCMERDVSTKSHFEGNILQDDVAVVKKDSLNERTETMRTVLKYVIAGLVCTILAFLCTSGFVAVFKKSGEDEVKTPTDEKTTKPKKPSFVLPKIGNSKASTVSKSSKKAPSSSSGTVESEPSRGELLELLSSSDSPVQSTNFFYS